MITRVWYSNVRLTITMQPMTIFTIFNVMHRYHSTHTFYRRHCLSQQTKHLPEHAISFGNVGSQRPEAPHTCTFSILIPSGTSCVLSQKSMHISPKRLFQPLHANAPFTGDARGRHGLAEISHVTFLFMN